MNYLEITIHILKQSISITGFVISMMLLIEFFNVSTKGRTFRFLKNNKKYQIITGVFLGLIPGCLGAYTAVSLYTHRLLSFGALVACMIATSGDETFLMLGLIPKKALFIIGIMAVVAFIAGFVIDKLNLKFNLFKNKKITEFNIHEEEDVKNMINLKNFKFTTKRIITILFFSGFAISAYLGYLGHEHANIFPENNQTKEEIHNYHCEDHEHHSHSDTDSNNLSHSHSHEGVDWVSITMMICALIGLFICLTCNEHFFIEHFINHIFKKHFLKIFLWTIFALLLTQLFLNYSDINSWISDNLWLILVLAILIGFIPESGPHIIFLTLYISGTIPLSILIANSIVQDGHGALPLFAESKRSFFVMKIINMLVGLLFGVVALLFGV